MAEYKHDPNDNISVGADEIEHRFGYHRPTPETAGTHIDLRLRFRRFAEDLDALLPPGRAKSVALTELENCSMWSHKAIAELSPVVSD